MDLSRLGARAFLARRSLLAASMDLWRPTVAERYFGLRALVAVAQAKGRPLSARERHVLAGAQQFFGTNVDANAVDEIEPEELSRVLVAPHVRRQVVAAMVALSLIDGVAGAAETELIADYAAALGVDEAAIRNVEKLARHEVFGLKIDLLRRFWAVDALRDRVYEPGLHDVLRFVRANVGRLDDPRLAARFQELRRLPPGTLGREYVRFLDERRWPLPGEHGALSDIIVTHDMTHVLSGYGTDPIGELETACLSAGSRRRDPTTFVLFVLLEGPMGPDGGIAGVGHIDVSRAFAAVARGAAMTVDLTDGWNYWAVIEAPVDALRRRYGIAPAGDTGRAANARSAQSIAF